MSQKMQKYVPAVHPFVSGPVLILGTLGTLVALASASSTWVFVITCVLYFAFSYGLFAFSFGLLSCSNKYLDRLALQNSHTEEIEQTSRLTAEQVSTVKWACQVWHEVTTLRSPLELSWSQLYDLSGDMGKAEYIRLGLKSYRAEIAGAGDDDTVDVSSPNRYPVSHDHAVELRNREASKWRDGSDWEYGKFKNKYGEGVIEAIADDDVIDGAYTLANEYLDALNAQEVDKMRSRVANRVQTIVDEYTRTRREGAKAYMDTIFKEE